MSIPRSLKKIRGRRAASTGVTLSRTVAIASEMALLCPSGIDVWVQREIAAGSGTPPPSGGRR